MNSFNRMSFASQLSILLAVLIAVACTGLWAVARSIVEAQSVHESRTVAEMVEHIGKWGAQYGGVHVKTTGTRSLSPGSYLERAVYAADEADAQVFSGTKLSTARADLEVLSRVHAYHWKNPALIQREIGEIAAASASNVRFRLTAASVLNPDNAPNAFEREALAAMAVPASSTSPTAAPAPEYWRVDGDRLYYARAMPATNACLRCHGSPDAAPGFLKTNARFNGGGGFGYEEGRTAGIISVQVPVRPTWQALATSLTRSGWMSIAGMTLAALAILALATWNVIRPLNRLRIAADRMADAQLGEDFEPPRLGRSLPSGPSRNEVHRLALALSKLGHSLQYMHQKHGDRR